MHDFSVFKKYLCGYRKKSGKTYLVSNSCYFWEVWEATVGRWYFSLYKSVLLLQAASCVMQKIKNHYQNFSLLALFLVGLSLLGVLPLRSAWRTPLHPSKPQPKILEALTRSRTWLLPPPSPSGPPARALSRPGCEAESTASPLLCGLEQWLSPSESSPSSVKADHTLHGCWKGNIRKAKGPLPLESPPKQETVFWGRFCSGGFGWSPPACLHPWKPTCLATALFSLPQGTYSWRGWQC